MATKPEDVTYYSDDNVAGILLIPHGIFSVIATCFVGLRLYVARSSSKSKARWDVDEIICLAALFANHCMLISEGVATHFGLGQNMNAVAKMPAGVTGVLKGLVAIEITYGTSCPLSKLSVLAMYYRVFSASKVLRYCVWVISSMLVGWGIAVVVVSIFSCTPVESFWDKTIVPTSCIDTPKFYIGITVPNIIFDVMTVVLPVREVWKLQMGRDKKLAATVIFILGGSVVLASFARLILFSIFKPGGGENGNNFSQTDIMPHSASAIETCLAIIGACLPPCAPLFLRALSAAGVTSGLGSSSKASSEPKNSDTVITIGKISNRARGRKKPGFDIESSFVDAEDGDGEGSTDNLNGGIARGN